MRLSSFHLKLTADVYVILHKHNEQKRNIMNVCCSDLWDRKWVVWVLYAEIWRNSCFGNYCNQLNGVHIKLCILCSQLKHLSVHRLKCDILLGPSSGGGDGQLVLPKWVPCSSIVLLRCHPYGSYGLGNPHELWLPWAQEGHTLFLLQLWPALFLC